MKLVLGNYTVERHGSRDQGTFDSISVETPREVRIDAGRDTRVEYGQALGRAIAKFYVANYPQVGQHTKNTLIKTLKRYI